MEELQAEVNRLRTELRVNKKAYSTLQKEKDDLSKALGTAEAQILKLTEDIDMRERLFSEYRETSEKEYSELLTIKQDLEMRLRGALEVNDEEADQQRLSISIGRNQAWWGQNSNNSQQLSCTEALAALKNWEGMEGTVKLLQELSDKEQDKLQWTPGAPWSSTWKPHLRLYVSAGASLTARINHLLLPDLEALCRVGGCSISSLTVSTDESEKAKMEQDEVVELCLQEVSKCDIFLCVLDSEIDILLTKLEVEHGFLNNPAARPSVFVFLDTNKSSVSLKLKQRVRKFSNRTKIIEGDSFNEEVVQHLFVELKSILKNKFDVMELMEGDQDSMFQRLSLLSDMRMEYEQQNILETLCLQSPANPAGIDIIFQNLTDYMKNDQLNVAPYLITAPPGAGKSTLLAKWYQYIKSQEFSDGEEIEVLYHFVTQSCSSSSETCLMYRRFILKLIHLCNEVRTVPSDPSRLEEVFTELLDKVSARLKTLKRSLVFILIDNVDQLVELTDTGWILKPLPQNIRVVLTANENASYPDSWKALPTSTLPSQTATDLQELVSAVQYGPKEKQLTEDQVISLNIAAPSDSSQLWSVMAAKFVLSASLSLNVSQVDDMIDSLGEVEEITDLAVMLVNDFISKHVEVVNQSVSQVLQLIYWSRNGLSLFELKKCCDIPETVLLYTLSELEKRHILSETAGLYRFTNETVQQVVNINYNTDFDNLLYWSEALISLFSDLTRQTLARCTSELLWLLKRGDMHQDLTSALLNVDILIQLYCGGESALLLRYWHWLSVNSTEIASRYYSELLSMEEQAFNDQSSILYIAMVMCTVGKILNNLGLCYESQPLLQRSLELYEYHSDPDSSEVGNAMYQLALLYTDIERYSAAESFYKQALEVFEHTCGENSKEVLKVLSSLSGLYKAMKRPDLFDTVTIRCYSVKEQIDLQKPNALSLLKTRADELENLLTSFEESDIPTQSDILAMNEWSLLHASFGDKRVAERYLLDNLQKGEEILGDDHQVTMILLKNMASFYQQNEKYQDAIPLQFHIVELKEKQHGNCHTTVASALNNLAVFHCCVGDYSAAIEYYDRALEIYQQLYDSNHSLVQDTLANRELATARLT